MTEHKIYQFTEGASNKFWEYTLTENKVEKRWGRVGGHITVEPKTYGSTFQAQNDIHNQAQKKLAKGYKLVDEEKIAQETEIAQALGHQYKISRLEFIGHAWDPQNHGSLDVSFSEGYIPDYGVCVEIMQSWSKETSYLVMTKKNAIAFHNAKITSTGAALTGYTYPESNFVAGVKKFLQTLQAAVAEVLVKFGAVGARTFDLGDDDVATPASQDFFKAVAAKSSGSSNQVVAKLASFAAMGARQLEI